MTWSLSYLILLLSRQQASRPLQMRRDLGEWRDHSVVLQVQPFLRLILDQAEEPDPDDVEMARKGKQINGYS